MFCDTAYKEIISCISIAFLKNMIGRFVKPQHRVNAGDDVKSINFSDRTYQLEEDMEDISWLAHTKQAKEAV